MPPFIPKKRLRDAESPAHAPPPKRVAASRSTASQKASKSSKKSATSLFDALDQPPRTVRPVEETKALLGAQVGDEEEDEDEDEDEEEEEFEDVPGVAANGARANGRAEMNGGPGSDSGEDEDEMDWEDALPATNPRHQNDHETPWPDMEIHDVSITLGDAGGAIGTGDLSFDDARGIVGKKGPSKRERHIRLSTHAMHVNLLLYHNMIRNHWTMDKEVQGILTSQLSDGVRKEIRRWRIACGMDFESTKESSTKGKGKATPTGTKGEGRQTNRVSGSKDASQDRIRDWGADAERQEIGTPDLSHGDPTVRLLKHLAAYWHKRFTITAPSLQKRGYSRPGELETEVNEWLESVKDGEDNSERFGERLKHVDDFRQAAKSGRGSQDVGAQLFTALLRGIGLQARMIASLQPLGIGFSKAEDGIPLKKMKSKPLTEAAPANCDSEGGFIKSEKKKIRPLEQGRKVESKPPRRKTRGSTSIAPISLDTSSDDELSDAPSTLLSDGMMNPTPIKPSVLSAVKGRNASPCPTYWTEVISPIKDAIIPVVSLPNPLIAISPELLASFTPSRKAAEKAKQVLAYVVAYSSDGTAKDVTVRYLKKKLWPGKTRGVRVPKEKIPVYDKRGKVKKWIEQDWFGDCAMTPYTKDPRKKSRWEKFEDDVDLVPVPATKKDGDENGKAGNVGGRPESLAAFKMSAEFVLERHLRREEAVLPGAEPVRHFTVGKGDKATEEPVYSRNDVVACKTVESWHKEGRCVRQGEQPLKQVPIRAVTLLRKREVEEVARETGEKPTQGLFFQDQTEWIIPDPLGADRKIPRNVFGNIDVYVPSMVPAGAKHLPLKGSAKLCKKLGIDFAEACTGFEFGNQRAVPVLTGVVVAKENESIVRDAWRAEQQRVKERERLKKREAALAMWKKLYAGLRISQRMLDVYGHGAEGQEKDIPVNNPFIKKAAHPENSKSGAAFKHASYQDAEADKDHLIQEELGGGFFREGLHVEDGRPAKRVIPVGLEDEDEDEDVDGGGSMVSEAPISLNANYRQQAEEVSDEEPSLQSDGATATPRAYTDRKALNATVNGSARKSKSVDKRSTAVKTKATTVAVNATSRKRVASMKISGKKKQELSTSDEQSDDGSSSDDDHSLESSFEVPHLASKKPIAPNATRRTRAPAQEAKTRVVPKRGAAKDARSRYVQESDEE